MTSLRFSRIEAACEKVGPGIWTVLDKNLSSANMVTTIRKDPMLNRKYEARSFRHTDDSGKVLYDIEVRERTVGNPSTRLYRTVWNSVSHSTIGMVADRDVLIGLVSDIVESLLDEGLATFE